jgi:hypothetical protein
MILTIIPTLWRRAAAGLLKAHRRNRGFFLPVESGGTPQVYRGFI